MYTFTCSHHTQHVHTHVRAQHATHSHTHINKPVHHSHMCTHHTHACHIYHTDSHMHITVIPHSHAPHTIHTQCTLTHMHILYTCLPYSHTSTYIHTQHITTLAHLYTHAVTPHSSVTPSIKSRPLTWSTQHGSWCHFGLPPCLTPTLSLQPSWGSSHDTPVLPQSLSMCYNLCLQR